MYERFRTEVISQLYGKIDSKSIDCVLNALDCLSTDWDIKQKTKELSVIGRPEFENILKSFIASIGVEGKSKGTLKSYYYTIRNFILAVNIPIEKVTTNIIRSYLFNYQTSHGISDRTLETMRLTLSSFFSWSYYEGYIPKNPCERISKIKYERKPRKALEQIELEHLRKACKTPRDKCVVEVLYSTGCRISELTGIKVEDIHGDSVEVLGKGKKRRVVYLNAKAIVAIEDYLCSKKKSSEYLISGERGHDRITTTAIQKDFRRLMKDSGVKCTPHILRHTFATQAVKNCEIVKVQKMLGHSNVSTTMQYAHVDDSDLRSIHSRAIV